MIIDYFYDTNQKNWLEQINQSEWSASKYLYQLINEDTIKKVLGDTNLLMHVDGENLQAFITLSQKDDVPNNFDGLWIGFVYTFPKYRGNRYSGKLIEYAKKQTIKRGYRDIYISTHEIGLYEKYGFTFFKIMKDVNNQNTRVYHIKL